MSEPFTVVERLVLLQFLRDQKTRIKGRIDVLRAVEQFGVLLSFSKAEQEALQFKQEGSQVNWNIDKAALLYIEVPPLAKTTIQKVLQDMAGANPPELGFQEMPLWDRFVEGKIPQDSPDGAPAEPIEVQISG